MLCSNVTHFHWYTKVDSTLLAFTFLFYFFFGNVSTWYTKIKYTQEKLSNWIVAFTCISNYVKYWNFAHPTFSAVKCDLIFIFVVDLINPGEFRKCLFRTVMLILNCFVLGWEVFYRVYILYIHVSPLLVYYSIYGALLHNTTTPGIGKKRKRSFHFGLLFQCLC